MEKSAAQGPALDAEAVFRRMALIRQFEQEVLNMFANGELGGTTHTCLGQEATAVAAMAAAETGDFIFSNHRCHGHYLARFGDIDGLLAELMGRADGLGGGRGGSQHLGRERFFTNGIQGGIVPNAVGAAMSEKIRGGGHIAMVFLGDGTLGQGVVYESFNLAALWSLPVLFIIENNFWAMSTPVGEAAAGSIAARPRAFGIETAVADTRDPLELMDIFHRAAEFVRRRGRPFCQIVERARLGPHSKGDDTRPPEILAEISRLDPLNALAAAIGQEAAASIGTEAARLVAVAKKSRVAGNLGPARPARPGPVGPPWSGPSILARREEAGHVAVAAALADMLASDGRVLLLGEDVRDPYGGAFKVTRGLSERFPGRVFNTPISEAGFTGLSVGLALGGLIPVVEYMFGDFMALAFDQLLNHAVKYLEYPNVEALPIIFRAPMGGGRGYGATHSQSLEKFFMGLPHLKILALSPLHDPRALYGRLLGNIESPTLVVESKRLYGRKTLAPDSKALEYFQVEESAHQFPVIRLTFGRGDDRAEAAIITYGGLTETALEAARRLIMEDDLLVDVVIPTLISPIDPQTLPGVVKTASKILILEEGGRTMGWGAELSSLIRETRGPDGCRIERLAAPDRGVPAALDLERAHFPGPDEAARRLREMQ